MFTFFHCPSCELTYGCKSQDEPEEVCPFCGSDDITTGLSVRDLVSQPAVSTEAEYESNLEYVYLRTQTAIKNGIQYVAFG